MVDEIAESKYGSWTSTEARLTIKYPLELLDEIRLNVCSSLHSNPHGVVGVGGLLFGTHSDDMVRLARSMEQAKTDPGVARSTDRRMVSLPHPQPLGLTESDLNVFSAFLCNGNSRWRDGLSRPSEQRARSEVAYFVIWGGTGFSRCS